MIEFMKKMSAANKRFYIVLGVIGALLVGWWAWEQFSPKPLGDLEYVGQRHYGCWLICDEKPGATYSYATNLTPPGLSAYLKGAQDSKSIEEWQNKGSTFTIKFISEKSGKPFTIYYYTNAQERIRLFNLKQTQHKYLIDIDASDYDKAHESL
jgi:hypothetical protein